MPKMIKVAKRSAVYNLRILYEHQVHVTVLLFLHIFLF